MNNPASKEPSMDEILSSIRQIIADEDVPGAETSTASAQPAKVEDAADAAMLAQAPEVPETALKAPAEPAEEEPFSLSPEQLVPEQLVNESDAIVEDNLADFSPATPDFDAVAPVAEPEVEAEPAEIEVEEFEETVNTEVSAIEETPLDMVIADDIAFDEVPPLEDTSAEAEPVIEAEPAPMPDPNLSDDMAGKLLEPTTAAAVTHTFAKLGALSAIGAEGITLDAIVREMIRPMLKEWLDENLPATVERMVEKEIERVSRGG